MASKLWSFNRHLVVLQKLDNAVLVHELSLNTVLLWVQVRNILVGFLNNSVVEDLCDAMGIVDHKMSDVEVDRGSFFRV